MKLFIFLLFIILITKLNGEEEIQSVSDEYLLQLIKSEDYLVVLFSKPNSEVCKNLENVLKELKADFQKELNAKTVLASNSHLVKLYNPTKEPALLFFRHGVPLLYNGPSTEGDIYPFFERNREPTVKELNDNIFEHMTQAATGATTGDWLVMFYSTSCVDCQRLQGVLEGVGATLKSRVNVARVDADGLGANTAKRFKVNKYPAFILFRRGKLFRYDLPRYDIVSLVSFAEDWYKNAKGENVPLLESPFDEILNWSVEIVKNLLEFGLNFFIEHPWIWQIGVFGFGLVVITAIISLFKARKTRRPTDVKKKSK